MAELHDHFERSFAYSFSAWYGSRQRWRALKNALLVHAPPEVLARAEQTYAAVREGWNRKAERRVDLDQARGALRPPTST